MKKLIIKIPTSFSEVKALIKERTSKRYKHNLEVINKIERELRSEIKSGYWDNDITMYMRNELTNEFSGKIHTIFWKYKKDLK